MKRHDVVIAILMFSLLPALILFQNTPAEGGGAFLAVQPPNATIDEGSPITVTLALSNITDTYGIDFELQFEPSVLEVLDADPGDAGVQIIPGNCPAPDFVILNEADNATGVIQFAVSQLNPTTPCNGGPIAKILFLGYDVGTSDITFH
jgi:hypothetical protein